MSQPKSKKVKKAPKTQNGLVIAVVDAGNGDNDALIAGSRYQLSAVCAPTDGNTLAAGKGLENTISYFDWKGHRYMAGDDVLNTLPKVIQNHLGDNRYGNDLQQRLLALVLAEAGVGAQGPQHVDLTLLAPPGLFHKLRPQIIERFRQSGPVEIHLKGEAKPRQWQYDQIRVLPEGVTAALALAFDQRGNPTGTKDLDGLTLVLDIGTYTFNILAMVNGTVDMENLHIATHRESGLDKRIRQEVLKVVHQHPDMIRATVAHVDAALRDPEHKVRVGGFEMDITGLLSALGREYADWIMGFIDSNFGGGAGFSHVLLVGGGAYVVGDYLRAEYGDRVIKTNVPPEWLNAEGAYRYRISQVGSS